MGAAAAAEPKQPPPPRPPRGSDDCDPVLGICGCILGALILLPILFAFFELAMRKTIPPEYSVAIAAATGLAVDRDARGAAAALDPEFSLTVRVASRSSDPACLDPATSVRVSYLRVPLAGGRVRPEPCAPPGGSADHAVVARGKAVAVPGYLLDSLAEDMRTRQAVFEVTLMSPAGGHWIVQTCWAKIGDAAALNYVCDTTWVDADVRMPVPQPARPAGVVIDDH